MSGLATFRGRLAGAGFLTGFLLASGPAETLESRELTDQIVGEPLTHLGPELLDVLHAL